MEAPLLYVGIDPGIHGAIVGASSKGKIAARQMPTITRTGTARTQAGNKRIYHDYDEDEIVALLTGWIQDQAHGLPDRVVAVVERASSRPEESAMSAFKFGVMYGLVAGIVKGLGMQRLIPYPITWRRAVLPKIHKGDKKIHAQEAERIFPALAPFLRGPRGGLRDGIADAGLLCQYGRLICS